MNPLLEKCYIYIDAVKDWEELNLSGLYRADVFRSQCHDELCEAFGLNKDETLIHTRNLEKLDYDGKKLYNALLKMKKLETF